jgi:hypothetical protein
MALAPLIYTSWQRFLRFDPENPLWPNRDRLVLSNGHASTLLYATLLLAGVKSAKLADGRRPFRLRISSASASSTARAQAIPSMSGDFDVLAERGRRAPRVRLGPIAAARDAQDRLRGSFDVAASPHGDDDRAWCD